jgi:hypothetical protein
MNIVVNIIDTIKTFAPDISLIEISITTLSTSYSLKKYIYRYNNLNIFTFEIRSYNDNSKIELVLDSSQYKYIIVDKKDIETNISNFLLHAKILADNILESYYKIKKNYKIIASYTNLNYWFLENNITGNSGSIYIKNGYYIFEYNETTTYKYSKIDKLLKNPLLKEFKRTLFEIYFH